VVVFLKLLDNVDETSLLQFRHTVLWSYLIFEL